MKFDFNEVVRDIKNQPAVDSEGPVTFHRVAIAALLAPEQTSGEEKAGRFALACKIERNPSLVDLSIEEVKVVRDRVDQYSTTVVVGRFREFLDNPLPGVRDATAVN